LSPEQEPSAQLWEQALMAASPILAADTEARSYLLERLSHQYLPAAFRAQTPETDARVWSSLSYLLRAPATARKPFELSVEEAEAVVAAVHIIVEAIRRQG